MTEHYKERNPALQFKVMDAKDMDKFEAGSFDAVIDKACFDAILCGENSKPNSEKALEEIHRVLGPTGVYISVSYGLPVKRLNYFDNEKFSWKVHHQKVTKQFISTEEVIKAAERNEEKNFDFIYIMQKKENWI